MGKEERSLSHLQAGTRSCRSYYSHDKEVKWASFLGSVELQKFCKCRVVFENMGT